MSTLSLFTFSTNIITVKSYKVQEQNNNNG